VWTCVAPGDGGLVPGKGRDDLSTCLRMHSAGQADKSVPFLSGAPIVYAGTGKESAPTLLRPCLALWRLPDSRIAIVAPV
jgi:hypothetical protein